jgi:hypothetical protein
LRLGSRSGLPAAQVAGLYWRPGKVVVANLGRLDHGIWHVRCTGTVATHDKWAQMSGSRWAVR